MKFVLILLTVVIGAGVLFVVFVPRCFDSDGKPIIRMGSHYCWGSSWSWGAQKAP